MAFLPLKRIFSFHQFGKHNPEVEKDLKKKSENQAVNDYFSVKALEKKRNEIISQLDNKDDRKVIVEEALFQGEREYTSKVAKTQREICSLVDAGFEYVTDFEGAKIFRKPKI